MSTITDGDVDILVREVGPREGFQIEQKDIPTEHKAELIVKLAQAGLRDIQVTSFVNPKRVPTMADAERLVELLPKLTGVRYSAVVLNKRGLERAIATGVIAIDPRLGCSASDEFSRNNVGHSIEQVIAAFPESLQMYRELGMTSLAIDVNAAFGCNWSGPVAPSTVLGLIERLRDIAERERFGVHELVLADTMGWGNPKAVGQLFDHLRKEWPGVSLAVHLHDTRGMGLANAYSAIESGVTRLDSSIGGLGGCPFGGFRGAAGNIATEDLVHMCDQLGLRTGVDCLKLLEATRYAEEIVGRPLPAKLLRGGLLAENGAKYFDEGNA